MCAVACNAVTKKYFALVAALASFALSAVVLICWDQFYRMILYQELSLKSNTTKEFEMWKETPIPMYIEFYLFNLTNAHEMSTNWSLKPVLDECGPYTFSEHHIRREVHLNDNNDTVTFKTERIWHYEPEKSKGSLDDRITNINVILATVGYIVRFKHILVKMGVDFFLKEKNVSFVITKSARELLFDGYEDPMLELAHKLNISGFNVPFEKFGWFYGRNQSIDYDGIFTMYTGADDIRKLGRLTEWNYQNRTEIYDDNCGRVKGTTGELWYPVHNDTEASIFSPDTCSTLTAKRTGYMQRFGIKAPLFVMEARNFDNGSLHKEMQCFSMGDSMPSGVRNVSQCKFGAPAFISFPHFYQADPTYRHAVIGMRPNRSEHEFYFSIEASTGVPLKINALMQININVMHIQGISLLSNMPQTMVPMMWFRQSAELTEELATLAKTLLVLPSVGHYTGYGLIALGILICLIVFGITLKDGWRGSDQEYLINNQKPPTAPNSANT